MYAISIDSGGTKVVGAVVDETGRILEKARHETTERNGDCLVAIYREIIREYTGRYPISVVGIGGNGRIDSQRGVILNCGVYSNWEGRHLKEELESDCGLPVSVNNDCYSAIRGELWRGAARNYRVVAGIVIGTGIGGALVSDGVFWRGAHYGAGEVGHMILHRDGLPCYCGQHGCVERYVSGTALWCGYNRAVGREALHSGYEFFDLVAKGDATARAVLDDFVENLSIVMCNIANLCDPDAFLIGGGISETRAVWADALARRFRERIGGGASQAEIVYASKGNDAALLGAAKFAFEQMERQKVATTA